MTTEEEKVMGRYAWQNLSDTAMEEIPEHLRDGLRLYLCEKIRPGRFLCSVLADELREVICRADSGMSLAMLRNLIQTLYAHFPSASYGSKQAVDTWLRGDNRA